VPQFVFKLDGVLRHRERIEQERQRDLAVAQAELAKIQNALSGIDDEVRTTAADVRDNHLVGRLNMGYLAAHRRYMLGMQIKSLGLVEKLNAQQRVVDLARVALAEASKQKKILEKLRERHHARWAADVARAEAGAMDELSTQMSYRTFHELSKGAG